MCLENLIPELRGHLGGLHVASWTGRVWLVSCQWKGSKSLFHPFHKSLYSFPSAKWQGLTGSFVLTVAELQGGQDLDHGPVCFSLKERYLSARRSCHRHSILCVFQLWRSIHLVWGLQLWCCPHTGSCQQELQKAVTRKDNLANNNRCSTEHNDSVFTSQWVKRFPCNNQGNQQRSLCCFPACLLTVFPTWLLSTKRL